jgi:hypothetical protein
MGILLHKTMIHQLLSKGRQFTTEILRKNHGIQTVVISDAKTGIACFPSDDFWRLFGLECGRAYERSHWPRLRACSCSYFPEYQSRSLFKLLSSSFEFQCFHFAWGDSLFNSNL